MNARARAGVVAAIALFAAIHVGVVAAPYASPPPGGTGGTSVPIPSGYFVENIGQIGNLDVRIYASAGGVEVGFAESAVLILVPGSAPRPASPPGASSATARDAGVPATGVLVRIAFEGANRVVPEGRGELPQRTHFFLGADSASWRTDVRSFREVRYDNLYPGIDLAYRIGRDGPKYEFLVRADADPARIRMGYEGAESLLVDPSGDLVIRTSLGDLRDTSPVSRQGELEVRCTFALRTPLVVGLDCPGREASLPLSIDPLVYSTFLGGGGGDEGRHVVLDAEGNAYVTGLSASVDFPTTPGAFQTAHRRGPDAFVAKVNGTGTGLAYATFIGGVNEDEGYAITLDASRNAYVTGYTLSADFPTTPGALDRTFEAGDAFVLKLSPQGDELLFSTFLGGASFDEALSIALDAAGNPCVAGETLSPDFPTTQGSFDPESDGGWDGFVARLNATGTGLLYSTYLGGYGSDAAGSLVLGPAGNVYVTGFTGSTDFPTTPGAYQADRRGNADAFVVELDAAGTALVYSALIGGRDFDTGNSLALDVAGNAYLVGETDSEGFPTTPGALDTTYNGLSDVFVLKLSPQGDRLLYSTFLGGTVFEEAHAIALGPQGEVHVVGFASSVDFPTTPGAISRSNGGLVDAFVAKVNAAGSQLVYSTFLGGPRADRAYGLALDPSGYAHVTGLTESDNFPTTSGAFDRTPGGQADAFLVKMSMEGTDSSLIPVLGIGLVVGVAVASPLLFYLFARRRRRRAGPPPPPAKT